MRSKKSPLWLLVLALMATALLAAGCGDDDDGGSGGGDTSAAQTETGAAETTTPPEETTEAGGEDTGGGAADPANPQVQQAIDACKQQVAANPSISDDTKKDIEEICDEIATGDADAIREKTKEVCIKVVEDTAPEGPARDQALMACDQATAAP